MSAFTCFVRVVSVGFVAVASFAVAPARSVAAPGFCSAQASYSGTTITWTGDASGPHQHAWGDPDNWDPTMVPDEAQDSSTYQTQYVCIGGGASVTIDSSDSYHVAGIDVGEGAQLVVDSNGGLYTGAAKNSNVVPSYVEKGSALDLDAATLGGNGSIDVAGTLEWAGEKNGKHRLAAAQSGPGQTMIDRSGQLLVDGAKFGAAILSDGRTIDNSGSLVISKTGFISMDDGTALVDEKGSTLSLKGEGGIYPDESDANASIQQNGDVVKSGKDLSVVGVPTTFGPKVKPVVKSGGLSFAAKAVPKAKLKRNASYGVGSCAPTDHDFCHKAAATKPTPQVAIVGTSTEAPKKSAITVALTKGPKKIKGNKVLGQSIDITAPTEKTTHSTDLTFDFDASTKGIGKGKQGVYRGKHKLTICSQSGLTAENTSCVLSHKVVKGDLEISVISIQPDATWSVA